MGQLSKELSRLEPAFDKAKQGSTLASTVAANGAACHSCNIHCMSLPLHVLQLACDNVFYAMCRDVQDNKRKPCAFQSQRQSLSQYPNTSHHRQANKLSAYDQVAIEVQS